MCAQRRLRSARASAKSVQTLCCPHEESLGPTHWAHSEVSDQTGRLSRLIWVFAGPVIYKSLNWLSLAGSTVILLFLSLGGSICSKFWLIWLWLNGQIGPGVRFTKVFRTELGHKYILVECSVIALCLPVMSKISRYKLVCYKKNNDRYEHKTYLSTKFMPCFKTFREIHPWTTWASSRENLSSGFSTR